LKAADIRPSKSPKDITSLEELGEALQAAGIRPSKDITALDELREAFHGSAVADLRTYS